MKAMIVDSSMAFQQLLSAVIEQAGYDVVTASGGDEALEKLVAEPFDLVCSSMNLDDMDAFTFCSYVRGTPETTCLPIILVTSSNDKSSLSRAISIGVTEVFLKDELDRIGDYTSQLVIQHGQAGKLRGNILYVEESKSVAAVTIALLQGNGLDVDHFTFAEDALKAFKDKDYDLVLTDVILEGAMSGFSLVREIRAIEGSKARVPVLALSGFEDSARKIELLRSGANDYISKPPLDEELMVRVGNHLAHKQLQDKIEAQQARLHEMAMKDQLTGLYNRHFLMEMAPSKLSAAYRHKFICSLIVVDVDHFKLVNDSHGHQAGDMVLQELAGVMSDACRQEDVAARFGGEEFVLFLSHCDAENAAIKAEKLRKEIETLRPAGLSITASFGVAEISLEYQCDFSGLFKQADEAVYEAKESGRNKVVNKGAVAAS